MKTLLSMISRIRYLFSRIDRRPVPTVRYSSKGDYIAQGDLNIFAVDAACLTGAKETDNRVLAHSETGHHHVIEGNAVRVLEQDEFVSYLDVQETAKIVHLRSFDTHSTIEVPPGTYRVTRQREYTPEGFRRAAD